MNVPAILFNYTGSLALYVVYWHYERVTLKELITFMTYESKQFINLTTFLFVLDIFLLNKISIKLFWKKIPQHFNFICKTFWCLQ